ncbi:regulating synaptic membrane exocytosis protein 2 isoform X1 [Vespula maculifrons]|uniref:Regulating synaptic membrane exocytosis protein 2 isoform X1 n=1 Tax=Vespula maculifrons TaxID=7453 RepID=A0ABD2BBY9_VESMC
MEKLRRFFWEESKRIKRRRYKSSIISVSLNENLNENNFPHHSTGPLDPSFKSPYNLVSYATLMNPEQIAKERQVTGRVQIQVSYENERKELIVSVFTADELCAREDTGYGTLPEAYANDQATLKTVVAEPTQNPIWNSTLLFPGVDGESLMDRAIEVSLWDYCPEGDNVFLGECTVDLQKALENDRADPRGLRSGKSPYCSPRGSLSMEVAQRFLRKNELRERSYSDDTQSDSGSPELCFLHPDHAWHVNSRRGSSQSEQLEVEPYELNRDYSRSLPGSRRSSFQSQCGTDSKRGSMGEADMPIVVHYNRERRRSSCTRQMRDPEEILEGLRTLKAAKGELNRTMSLTGDKRRGSREYKRCSITLVKSIRLAISLPAFIDILIASHLLPVVTYSCSLRAG